MRHGMLHTMVVYAEARWFGVCTILCHTGVCENNTPPERRTDGKISFQSTKSGAGEQLLLQDCMAKAPI